MPDTRPNMRIVYDRDSKKILQVSISAKKEPRCQDICRFHDGSHIIGEDGHCTNCDHCFSAPADEDIFEKQDYGYDVDDSQKGEKRTVRSKGRKIVISCDQDLIDEGPPRRYRMIGQSALVTVSFKDEDGAEIRPSGKFTIKASGGKLGLKKDTLDGSVSETSFIFTLPKDSNADIKFKARIEEWHPRSYNSGTQMVIEQD